MILYITYEMFLSNLKSNACNEIFLYFIQRGQKDFILFLYKINAEFLYAKWLNTLTVFPEFYLKGSAI